MRTLFKAPSLTLACALLAGPASADFIGLTAGKSLWMGELTGESQSQISRAAKQKPVDFNKLALTSEQYPGFWVAFEHPIPLLPNVRLSYTEVESAKRVRDTTVITGGDGIQISNPQNIDTAMAFNNVDASFYYEILDNWVNLDLGLSVRKLEGYLDVYYELSEQFPRNFPHSYTKLDEVIPMLYTQAQLDIPTTGLFIQTRLYGITSANDRFLDGEINLGYLWEGIPGVDIGITAGYRTMHLNLDNTSNLYADAQIEGFQGSVFVHF